MGYLSGPGAFQGMPGRFPRFLLAAAPRREFTSQEPLVYFMLIAGASLPAWAYGGGVAKEARFQLTL
jgi:hypothetical protein